MARVPITEWSAKKLLLGDAYTGVFATYETLESEVAKLTEGLYVVKVDTGVKKRGKSGLVKIKVEKKDAADAARELLAKGHDRVIIETFVPHDDSIERYMSIDLKRDDATLLYANHGGVEVESNHDAIQTVSIPRSDVLSGETKTSLSGVPLPSILKVMQDYHFSFLEINPYVIQNDSFTPLDLAVEIDSARSAWLPAWVRPHILGQRAETGAEQAVEAQNDASQSSLNLHTLNPDGSILTMLSGGGASLVAMDSLVSAGLSDEIINYSEYSGAPTRDELRVYTGTLLSVLFASPSKKKVILIAGGIANFTDIMETFSGIIDAFGEHTDELKRQGVFVVVRRGGPNQERGLAHLRQFLEEAGIPAEIHGPELSLGDVGTTLKPHLV